MTGGLGQSCRPGGFDKATEVGDVMKGLLKYLFLPVLVVGVLANMKDIKRYIRIRNM